MFKKTVAQSAVYFMIAEKSPASLAVRGNGAERVFEFLLKRHKAWCSATVTGTIVSVVVI